MGRSKKQRQASKPLKASDMTYPYAYGGEYGYAGTSGRNRDLIRTEAGAALAYQLVGTVNRCIEIITNAVNNIGWELVVGEGDNEKIIASHADRTPKHAFAMAMRGVYVEQSIPLRKLMGYSELIYGETFIEKLPIELLKPRGIKWLNPLWTYPQIISGRIEWFRYSNPWGDSATLAPCDVAYEHTFNPQNDLRGYSVVNAVLDEINIDRDLKRFLKAFFRNNARPGMVVSPKGDARYNQQDIAIIKEQLQNYMKGVDNGNSALVSPISAVYEAFESPDVDKQYKISEVIRTEIYMGFGVPPSMAGDSGGATYKDGEEVLEAFYFNTINPMAERQAAFINVFLMPFFDPSGQTTFRVITPQPRNVILNKTAEAALVDMQVKGGYLSLADGARAMKLTPDPRIENLYMINNVPVPIDMLPTYYERMNAQPAQSYNMPQISTSPTPQLNSGQSPVGEQITPRRTMKFDEKGDYCILASLSNDPAIKSIQDIVRGLIKSDVLEWQDPATFHLTLCYASGTIEQTDSVSLEGSLQTLIVDRVDSFDTPEGYAVHLKVRPTLDITAYQERLVGEMRLAGMDVSTYSDVWEPHITLCYASEPFTPFSITPIVLTTRGVDVSDDTHTVIASGTLKSHKHKEHKHDNPAYEFTKGLSVTEWRERALDELRAWIKRDKAGKSFGFQAVYTADILRSFERDTWDPLSERTAQAWFDYAFAAVRYEPFKTTLARIERAFLKSFDDTRQEFEDEFLLAIGDAKDGSLTKDQLKAALEAVIRNLGEQAYLDGLEDGGIENPELDSDDIATIDNLRSDAEGYLTDFIASFDTKTDVQLDQTPTLWSNKTLQTFYDRGLAAADINGSYIWRLGKTEIHCPTCLGLNGTKMRMKNWLKNGILPKSDKLLCGGWQCDCTLEPVRGR